MREEYSVSLTKQKEVKMISFLLTLKRMLSALWKAIKDKEFQVLFFLTTITLVSGTIFYHTVESWSLLDSLYFSVVTLTTVGFGDFSPQTDFGKIFTIIYLFTGVGLILGFINKLALHMGRSKRKQD